MKEDDIIAVYRDVFPEAARLLRRMGGELEEIRDVFQDALVIYLEKKMAGKLVVKNSEKAYLLGIVKYLWLQAKRKDIPGALPEEIESYIAEKEEPQHPVAEYLVMAGRRCMDMLVAFYYNNQTMQEIAERFGFNGARSATVQKYKCLEKIRSVIHQSHVYAK